jgi:hypothetical protein
MTLLPIYQEFTDGATITALGYDIVLRRRSVGNLELPTGRLIACDPLDHPDSDPFAHRLPPGSYPVKLVVADMRDETHLAYAIIELGDQPARRWQLALAEGEEAPKKEGEGEGYQVLSSVGCFMDAAVAQRLVNYWEVVTEEEDDELLRDLRGQLRKQRKWGAGYANIGAAQLGANIIAFEAGEGYFPTYLGFDEQGHLTRVVTDFQVLDLSFPSFAFNP